MEAWLGYSPRDFLLFSAETYWRLFELHNAALWPLPLATLTGLALLLGLALAGWRWAGLAISIGLAAASAFVAEAFLHARYEPINWAVAYVTPLFWAEALGLLLIGPWLRFRAAGPEAKVAAVLVVAALAYPLAGLAAGRPLAQAEVAGIAPDPTALATLGLLGFAGAGWLRLLLSLVPALWLAASALTLLTMNAAAWWVPLAALALTLATWPWRRPGAGRLS